ncbi:hypothetical protein PS15p_205835 [Mucor circinelloides]
MAYFSNAEVSTTDNILWEAIGLLWNNKQESDEQEQEKNEQAMNHLLNKLRAIAKKRILNGTMPLSESLYIRKTKGLSSVLLYKAAELVCQSRMESKDMELMKLCLSCNIKFMNQNVSVAEANSVINAHPWYEFW